jgi:hypothetical protein
MDADRERAGVDAHLRGHRGPARRRPQELVCVGVGGVGVGAVAAVGVDDRAESVLAVDVDDDPIHARARVGRGEGQRHGPSPRGVGDEVAADVGRRRGRVVAQRHRRLGDPVGGDVAAVGRAGVLERARDEDEQVAQVDVVLHDALGAEVLAVAALVGRVGLV